MCYTRCIFVTAGVVEGPLVVLESLLRSVVFLALSLVYSILYIIKMPERDYWYNQIKKTVREAIICAACALTFLLPLAGCFVSRSYRSSEEECDLAPMPTLVGWVDTEGSLCYVWAGAATQSEGTLCSYKMTTTSARRLER